jgi:tetratricopeptide (TPR) repeat protein
VSQSPGTEEAGDSPQWLEARVRLSEMIKQGRSFSSHERNCVFLNTSRSRFATVSGVSGLDMPDDGRAVTTVDWDQDGDLDIWISNRNSPRLRMFRNDYHTYNHFVAFRLEAHDSTTNPDAIGARVEIILDDEASKRLVKTLRAGEGFLAQSAKTLHFGLGSVSTIRDVVVRWPGGIEEHFGPIDLDGSYVLHQGQARPIRLPWPSADRTVAIEAGVVQPSSISRQARIPLFTELRMPRVEYTSHDGQQRSLNVDAGRPVLINLWASWCRPCLDELANWTRGAEQLRKAGIDVVALSVDELDLSNHATVNAAEQAIRRTGFPFTWGKATQALLDDLQELHDDLVVLRKPFPLPSSFLVNAEGRLAVIYRGPASIEDIVRDATVPPPTDYANRFEAVACLAGSALTDPVVVAKAHQAHTRTRFRLASSFRDAGRLEESVQMFEDLLRFDPGCAEAHGQLGAIRSRTGDLEKAVTHCQQALQLNERMPAVHNTLGNLLGRQGKLAEAQVNFERAIRLQPDFVEAHQNLGTLLASQGEFAAAEQHLLRAIELEPNLAETHNNLGSLYVATNRIAKAAQQYALAIQLDPNYADAHNNLGTLYARRGMLDKAILNYRRALELDPDYDEAKRNLLRAESQRRSQP